MKEKYIISLLPPIRVSFDSKDNTNLANKRKMRISKAKSSFSLERDALQRFIDSNELEVDIFNELKILGMVLAECTPEVAEKISEHRQYWTCEQDQIMSTYQPLSAADFSAE